MIRMFFFVQLYNLWFAFFQMLFHYIIDIAGYARFGFDDQKQLLDQADILLLDTDMCPLCQRFTSKVFLLINGTPLINARQLFLFFWTVCRFCILHSLI